MHDQRIGRVADQTDRREILAWIVTGILIKRRSDRERAGISQRNRVAVGSALGHLLGADGAAGAKEVAKSGPDGYTIAPAHQQARRTSRASSPRRKAISSRCAFERTSPIFIG